MADQPIGVWRNGQIDKIRSGDTPVDGDNNEIGAVSNGNAGTMLLDESITGASGAQTVATATEDPIDVFNATSGKQGLTESFANGRWTVDSGQDGKYSILFSTSFSLDTASVLATFQLYKNGSPIEGGKADIDAPTSGDVYNLVLGAVVDDLVETDTVSIRVQHDNGSNVVFTFLRSIVTGKPFL